MERSKFGELNVRDFIKGLLTTLLASVLTTIIALAKETTFFSKETLFVLGTTSISCIAGYLLKNLFTNSKGELFSKER